MHDGLTTRDRRALYAIAVQFFVNGAMTASFLARFPELRAQVGANVDRFGLMLTLAGSVALGSSALAGPVIERWHTRAVLLAGGLLTALALVLIGRARALWQVGVALGCYGAFDVMVDISMNLQGSWLSARRRVPVMNRLHGMWSVGAMVGGLVAAQSAARQVSVATQLAVTAIVLAMVIVAVSRQVLPRDEADHGDERARQTAGRPPGRIVLFVLAIGGACAMLYEAVPADWSALRLSIDFGAPPAVASLAFVAFSAGMTIGRFGGDSVEHLVGRSNAGRLAGGVSVVGLVLATLVDVRGVAMFGFLLAGLGVATAVPRLYDDAARMPGRRGAGLGMLTAGMRVAGLSAPVVVGALAATPLSVGGAMAIVTIPAAVTMIGVSEVLARHARLR